MRAFSRLTVLALALVAWSCGDQAPTGPAQPRQFSSMSNQYDHLARYQTGQLHLTIAFAMKMIGPDGGQLALAGFELIVPPGAVSKYTLFSIRLPVDLTSSEYVRAEFGPHQEFAVPLTIRLPLKGTTAENAGDAHILWWNGYDWEPFATTATSDGRIETQTWHFSEFGTEDPNDPSKGIILVGGGK
jgi:hypothetical protein